MILPSRSFGGIRLAGGLSADVCQKRNQTFCNNGSYCIAILVVSSRFENKTFADLFIYIDYYLDLTSRFQTTNYLNMQNITKVKNELFLPQ